MSSPSNLLSLPNEVLQEILDHEPPGPARPAMSPDGFYCLRPMMNLNLLLVCKRFKDIISGLLLSRWDAILLLDKDDTIYPVSATTNMLSMTREIYIIHCRTAWPLEGSLIPPNRELMSFVRSKKPKRMSFDDLLAHCGITWYYGRKQSPSRTLTNREISRLLQRACLRGSALRQDDLTHLNELNVFHWKRNDLKSTVLTSSCIDCVVLDATLAYSTVLNIPRVQKFTFKHGYRLFDPTIDKHMQEYNDWLRTMNGICSLLNCRKISSYSNYGTKYRIDTPRCRKFYKDMKFGAIVREEPYCTLSIVLKESIESQNPFWA